MCSVAIVHFAFKGKKGQDMAIIKQVKEDNGLYGSLLAGDELVSINGIKIIDCFDYMFYFNDYFSNSRGKPLRKRSRSRSIETENDCHLPERALPANSE